MKKLSAFIIPVLLVSVPVIAVSGCNHNEKQARQLLENAYEKSRKVAENQVRFEEKGKELLEFVESSALETEEEKRNVDQYFKELTDLADSSGSAVEEASAEYGKVLDLEDVELYKEYARNRIEATDLLRQRTDGLRKFYEIFKRSFEESLAGNVQDEAAIISEVNPIVEERERLDEEIERLNDEAADLREELGLDF